MSDTLKSMLQASLEEPESPLKEIDPASLDELWRRINLKLVQGLPAELADEDIESMVQILISQRNDFLTQEEALKSKQKTSRKKPETLTVSQVQAVLDDLL